MAGTNPRGMMTMPRIAPLDHGRTVTAQAIKQKRSKWLLVAVAATFLTVVAAAVFLIVLRKRPDVATNDPAVAKGPLSSARVAFGELLDTTPASAATPPPVIEDPAPEPTQEQPAPEPVAQVEPEPAPEPEPASEPEPAPAKADPAPKPTPTPAAAQPKPAADPTPKPAAEPAPKPVKGTGTITIVCLPKCKEIYDNGTRLGPGPITNRTVSAGVHTIRLVGLDDKKKTVSARVPVDGHTEVRQFVTQ